jgi:dethiobiotin synthetase
MRGVFVTGTDTGVGKTIVSAALMAAFPNANYWKPVQSGSNEDDDTHTVRTLANASPERCWEKGYRLAIPASPHHAAEAEGVEITLEQLNDWCPKTDGPWVVEGAGGLLVPLSRTLLLPDLIRALELPALVVSSTRLGTINHSLMTVETLRSMNIPTLGLVMNGERDPSAISGLASHACTDLLLEVFPTEDMTPYFVQSLAASLAHIPSLQTALG